MASAMCPYSASTCALPYTTLSAAWLASIVSASTTTIYCRIIATSISANT